MDLVRFFGRLSCARAVALSILLCSAAAGACGSASQSVTAPGGVKCAVGATTETTSFGPAGGAGSVSVTSNRECRWAASTSGAWLQLNGAKEGQGDGQIPFSVSANSDTTSRRGAIVVDTIEIAIVQEPAACRFTVSPLSTSVPPAGGTRTIDVTANGVDCAWTARSERDWLVVVEGNEHRGSGRVVFEARPTTGPTRSGSLVVAGHTVTVTQGDGCSTSVSPPSHSIGASGGSAAVSVVAGPGCSWTASSDVSWITIASGTSGTGPGTVTIAVAAWNGPTRTGTIKVGSQVVTITQMAGCSFSIDPRERSAPAAGGTGTVSVSTAPGCAWTASSQAPWISIESGGNGNGAGQVAYRILGNSGPERRGTLTIAGLTHTVTQSGSCRYDIDPAVRTFAPDGGPGSTTVSTDAGCGWSVGEPSADWITVSGEANRIGPGPVNFTVQENDGPDRSATIAIAGQVFTIQQSSCTFSLSAPGQAFDAAENSGSVTLATVSTCNWSATTSAAWIRITSPASGEGPATIAFTVEQNAGELRSGTITAGGQVFTVTQAGPSGGL